MNDTDELVDKANRFMDQEDGDKQDITEEHRQLAIAIRRNFNHDATQPYTPAEEFTFHRVTYKDRDGIKSFVCSNYQIKEQMITFYDVRIKTVYTQDDVEPLIELKFGSGWDNYVYGILGIDHARNTDAQFKVAGYKSTDCKTIIREKLEDIDSFTVQPSESTWYNLNEDMAKEQSAMLVESFNENAREYNNKVLGEEYQGKVFEYFIKTHKDGLISRAHRKYYDANRFVRLFMSKPTDASDEKLVADINTPSEHTYKHMIEAYTKYLKDYDELKEYDWSVFLALYGDDETDKPEDVHGDIIEAEFEEVE